MGEHCPSAWSVQSMRLSLLISTSRSAEQSPRYLMPRHSKHCLAATQCSLMHVRPVARDPRPVPPILRGSGSGEATIWGACAVQGTTLGHLRFFDTPRCLDYETPRERGWRQWICDILVMNHAHRLGDLGVYLPGVLKGWLGLRQFM